jgi:hypothetical protein
MVEIELVLLKQQCLAHSIAERETLERKIALWQTDCDQEAARIQWMFTEEQAHENSVALTGHWQSCVQRRQQNKRPHKPFKFPKTRY